MSKYLDHNESISSYLDGLMSPDEMQEFEKQLHTDPVLRSEFELQQDIVNTLKDFRKTELKTRLDQVPVSMGPNGLVGIKAAAALVISGVIGFGAYLYFANPEEAPIEVTELKESVQIETPENIEELNSSEQLTAVEPEIEQPTQEELNSEPIVKEDVIVEEIAEAKPAEVASEPELTEEEVSTPVINSPNLINPDFEETDIEESFEIPTAALAQEGLADNQVVAVETAKRDLEMFHYQYYSGKLYLYGDFRDQPYEILELNSANGKRLFIFYNDDYYRIVDNQKEITPLVKLLDADIIQKLEIIQANK